MRHVHWRMVMTNDEDNSVAGDKAADDDDIDNDVGD